jgi:hypothetical protein
VQVGAALDEPHGDVLKMPEQACAINLLVRQADGQHRRAHQRRARERQRHGDWTSDSTG